MGAPQYEQAGADIGGTGTTNTIPRWTGPSTLGDSVITQSGSFIGIGTASPVTKLDVADANLPSGVVGIRSLYTGTITANAGGVLALGGYFTGTSPTTFAYIVGGKDNATAGDFGGHLQFITRPNGGVYTERARIDSAGNFGIGTASPDVFSRGYGRVLGISGASSTAIGINAATGNVAYFDMGVNATRSLSLTTDGTTPSIAAIGALPLTFVTNSLERARIDSSGNVGIGTGAATTTPAATGSLVIGQNNVSQQWAARIYGGNDANRAPVLSLFRAGNTEGIIAEIKNGAVGALALGITGGVANFNDATLSAACQVQITSTLLDISGTNYGLKLPATPGNTDPNTLDCYADGGTSGGATWAPVDNSGAGLTFTVTSARYIRIGRLVVASFDITFPATASGAQAKVSLPVTAQAVWQGASIGFGPNVPGLSAAVNNADLNFWTYGAATTNAALSGARLIVTMSYFAN